MSRIIQGDSLTVLKTLESESVDCCITSPPYWGLRDYGTAKWEDGDTACDHKEGDKVQGNPEFNKNRPSREATSYQFKEVCKICGAVRKDNQLGLEKTPEEYVAKMVEIFREVKRVLKDEGTLWLNLGDTYSGTGAGQEKSPQAQGKQTDGQFFENAGARNLKSAWKELPSKNLVGIPWRVAFALQADGWYLRQDIIWHKPNPMPESVTDRCTKAHEYIFLLAKSQKYYFDNDSIREPSNAPVIKYNGIRMKNDGLEKYGTSRGKSNPSCSHELGRNKRSVWTVTTKPFREAHFATFPEDLILPCVLAGCPQGGIILDPFFGAGTTGVVAKKNNRNFIGIELNPKYIKMAQRRIDNTMGTML